MHSLEEILVYHILQHNLKECNVEPYHEFVQKTKQDYLALFYREFD